MLFPQAQGMSAVVQHRAARSRAVCEEAQCTASNAQHAVEMDLYDICSHIH